MARRRVAGMLYRAWLWLRFGTVTERVTGTAGDGVPAESRVAVLEGALRLVADSYEAFGKPWDRLPWSITRARAALAGKGEP